MPEGDTVFRQARMLHLALAGRVLTGCDLRVPAFATVDLAGREVREVASRGKHLLLRVGVCEAPDTQRLGTTGADGPEPLGPTRDEPLTVRSHLMMEGEWQIYAPGVPWRRPAHQARAVLTAEGVQAVGFALGVLEVLPTSREADALGHLSPDLLGLDWDAAEAVRRMAAHPDVPIAVALLDQRNLAGLGNEYVNEICFLRGILPTRPVHEVDLAATVDLAHRMITANLDRPVRTSTGDTRRGRTTYVHRRERMPCRRCGTPVARLRLGRSATELRETWYCPTCQR